MPILALTLLLVVTPLSAFDDDLHFNRDIRPILSEHCFSCHGPDEQHRRAGLRLDLASGAFADRDGLRAIVPGDPASSELIRRIKTGDSSILMPPLSAKHPLSADQIAILERWVENGAPYADHWSFVPATKPTIPISSSSTGNEIDAFVGARLERAGMHPSPQARLEMLVRRLTLDLTGLPPTPSEIDAFLSDQHPRAYERLVDSLLLREATAERLALEWLDVARYADTNGYSIDDHRDMWPWRDWVIEAFRVNKPYDEFLVEQLAGDLLPEATMDQKLATGFLRNAMNTHEGGTIAEEYRVASIVDKLDTVGTAFMGLTVKCAQCHDHKYDPISQREYYELFAFFNQSSEGGAGAVNGNTAPLLSLGKEWGETDGVLAAYRNRRADLTLFLAELHKEERRLWEAGLETIPEAPTTEDRGPHEVFTEAKSRWVWAPQATDGDSLSVSHSFSLQSVSHRAELAISCDNQAEVFLNGKPLATVDPWMKPYYGDVSNHLRPGTNVLRIEARNQGGVAGLLVGLVDDRGGTLVATTDTWEFTRPEARGGLAVEGRMRDLGSYGAKPWGLFEPDKDPRLEAARVASIEEQERTPEEWSHLLEVFATSVEGEERVLLERQIAAVLGEVGLVDGFLGKRNPNVMILDHGTERATYMLDGGQYDKPGEEVTAGVPASLSWKDQGPVTNRLELARWLVDRRHPLTARVTVNRYWQLMMGRGLVETSEDLGSQGAWPSHPELLDWLAVSFVEHGWDVRWLLKTIVMSSTYRQSSHVTDELLERDPYNRWLSRGGRRRLPAESVRDGALFVAGLLSPGVGGPSVYPDQPDGLWRQVSHFGYPGFFSAQSFYPSVGEGRYRRSMYTFWKRTAPPPAMVTFDAPNRETCTVRRPTTNTPLQALVTLNEPQFMNAARALGAQMVGEGPRSAVDRHDLESVFRKCTSRYPTKSELALLVGSYERHHAHYVENVEAARELSLSCHSSDERVASLAAATLVASTILNLDETLSRP